MTPLTPLVRVEDLVVHFPLRHGQVVRAVDGVSLTVNEVDPDGFGVNVIPHTWTVTTLGQLKPGASVHIEIDMLARYVARLAEMP